MGRGFGLRQQTLGMPYRDRTLASLYPAFGSGPGAHGAPTGPSPSERTAPPICERQARALGFASSPTIKMIGRDIADELVESSCSERGELCGRGGGVDCRVWNYRGETHTEAPTGVIVEAILSEIGPSDPAQGGARRVRPGGGGVP